MSRRPSSINSYSRSGGFDDAPSGGTDSGSSSDGGRDSDDDDDDPSTGASSGLGGSIPGAPSGGGRDDDDDRRNDSRASRRVGGTGGRDRDDDDDDRRDRGGSDDFRRDQQSSRRVGGSGDPTVSDTRIERATADINASLRVGGSGDPFDEPVSETVDIGAAADSGQGPRVGISDQSPFTDVAAAAELDAQTVSDVGVSDIRIDNSTARLSPGAAVNEGLQRRDRDDDTGGETGDEPGALDRAARSYTERVAEPIGEVVGDATPATAIEERVTGTNVTETFVESTATGVAQLGNVPGALAGLRDATERADQDFGRATLDQTTVGPLGSTAFIPTSGTRDVAGDLADDTVSVASAAASTPIETAGTAFGAAAGGAIGSRAAFGAARRARSGSSTARSVDDMVVDQRIISDGGRQRVDDIEQETIAIERMAEDDGITRTSDVDDITDIPGVSRGAPGQSRSTTTAAQQLEAAVDDLEDTQTRTRDVDELTARERADEQIPPAREFETQQARQAEVDRLTERFRQQDADAAAVERVFGSATADAVGLSLGATTAAAAADEPTEPRDGASAFADRAAEAFGLTASTTAAAASAPTEPREAGAAEDTAGAFALGGVDTVADTQQEIAETFGVQQEVGLQQEAATQQELGVQQTVGVQQEVGLQQEIGVQQLIGTQQTPTITTRPPPTITTTFAPPTTTTTRRPPTDGENRAEDELFFGVESESGLFDSDILGGAEAARDVLGSDLVDDGRDPFRL